MMVVRLFEKDRTSLFAEKIEAQKIETERRINEIGYDRNGGKGGNIAPFEHTDESAFFLLFLYFPVVAVHLVRSSEFICRTDVFGGHDAAEFLGNAELRVTFVRLAQRSASFLLSEYDLKNEGRLLSADIVNVELREGAFDSEFAETEKQVVIEHA